MKASGEVFLAEVCGQRAARSDWETVILGPKVRGQRP
jgi:hypothetical protein